MKKTTCTQNKYERNTAESGLASRNSKGSHKRYGFAKKTTFYINCFILIEVELRACLYDPNMSRHTIHQNITIF